MPPLKHYRLFRHDAFNGRELAINYLSDETVCGRLFIILEVQKNKLDQQALLDELVNQAANHFISSNNTGAEDLLEEILQKINALLPELSAASKIRNWLYTLDMAIGIIGTEQILLSGIGRINAWVITHSRLAPVLQKNENFNPSKAFSDICSGQLDEGDVFIVTSSSLFDYIAKEKIKQIARRYTPQATVLKINSLLQSVPDFVTFNALFIKNPSLTDLDLTSESIRARSELAGDQPVSSDLIPAEHRSNTNLRPGNTWDKPNTDSVFKKIKKILQAFTLFFLTIYKVLRFIVHNIVGFFRFIFSRQFRQNREEQVLDNVKDKINERYHWWQRLNTAQKLSLIGLLLTLLIFIQSVVVLSQKRSISKQDHVYQELVQVINGKFTEAESKLIYNDQIAAENLLLEIEATIKDLTINTPQQKKEIASIQEKITHKLNEVRRIHEVPEPLELADLSSLINPRQIVQKEGNFYILDDKQLYQIKDKLAQPLFEFSNGQFLADWPNTQKLILGNNEQYFIYDLASKKNENFPLAKSSGNTSVQDINIYSSNLYVLDAPANQIFKYPEANSGFDNGQVWLKDQADIKSVSSFTVDGNIYTIDNLGQIKKFIKGRTDKFDYQVPRPPIGNRATIQTFRDSQFLYIIDPPNKRVIILNKDGNIKDQYTSDKFDNLLDLTIDPAEKAIYLLNGQHLYLLAINQ